MADYDPKRPRRSAGSDHSPAPVDALIDLAAVEQPVHSDPEPVSVSSTSPAGSAPSAGGSPGANLPPVADVGAVGRKQALAGVLVLLAIAALVMVLVRRRRG